MGSVAKSYLRKGLLIYEEIRKYLVIYNEEAVSHMWLFNCSRLNFLILIWGELYFLFYQYGLTLLDWLTGRAPTSLSTTILQRMPADISGRKYGFHDNLYQNDPSLYDLTRCFFCARTHCTRRRSTKFLRLELSTVRRILSGVQTCPKKLFLSLIISQVLFWNMLKFCVIFCLADQCLFSLFT